jgi:hypothetical protein
VYYNRNVDYNVALQEAHQAFLTRFKKRGATKNAQELESILREIKTFSSQMNSLPEDDEVYKSLKEQYFDLIQLTTNILNNRRKGSFSSTALFNRRHYNDKTGSGIKAVRADDIFEEELAALFSATEFLGTNNSEALNADIHLFGRTYQTSRAINLALDKNYSDNSIREILRKLAEKLGREYQSDSLQIKTGKTDVKGLSASLEISQNIPFSIERLFSLIKGKSFTVKNYSSFTKDTAGKPGTKDLADIGIHLGNSNLYKAITGAMSELGLGSKQLLNFFYRGSNTILNDCHGYGDSVQKHWSHMRLIYELRGSGLLDENGHVSVADYIIWNDPNTDNITVADTATLLFNLLNSNNARKSLFNDVQISALQVSKGKTRI